MPVFFCSSFHPNYGTLEAMVPLVHIKTAITAAKDYTYAISGGSGCRTPHIIY